MSYYESVQCELCGDMVNPRNLHYHKNSFPCEIARERQAAKDAGYIYEPRVGNVSIAQWALPFIKKFNTGEPKRAADKAEFRWWAQAWWWDIYCKLANVPGRVEMLEQLKDFHDVGDMEQIENLIGGIEMMRDQS